MVTALKQTNTVIIIKILVKLIISRPRNNNGCNENFGQNAPFLIKQPDSKEQTIGLLVELSLWKQWYREKAQEGIDIIGLKKVLLEKIRTGTTAFWGGRIKSKLSSTAIVLYGIFLPSSIFFSKTKTTKIAIEIRRKRY